MAARLLLFPLAIFLLITTKVDGSSVASAFQTEKSGHELEKRDAIPRTGLDSADYDGIAGEMTLTPTQNGNFDDVVDIHEKVTTEQEDKNVLRNFYSNLHTVDYALARLEQALAEEDGDTDAGPNGDNVSEFSDYVLGENDEDLDDLEKRPAFSSWSGKRAYFSPWSGKRSDKRVSFSPWSGKRAYFSPWSGKRAAFSPWLGKRDSGVTETFVELGNVNGINSEGSLKNGDNEFFQDSVDEHGLSGSLNSKEFELLSNSANLDPSVNSETIGKRPSFSPWSGKRNEEHFPGQLDLDKRPAFQSWSGKRNSKDNVNSSDLTKRPSFNPWSGKRDNNGILDSIIQDRIASLLKRKRYYVKKPSFNPWSGKRSSSGGRFLQKKPSFNPWSGKRSNNLDSFLVDRFIKRQAFSPWSGKRTDGLLKRPAFNAWSGKRKRGFVRNGKAVNPDFQSELDNDNIWDDFNGSPMFDDFGKLSKDSSGPLFSKSHERAELLTTLASLYNRLVNQRRQPSQEADEKILNTLSSPVVLSSPESMPPKDSIVVLHPHASFNTEKKRPAFSAWGGKRKRRKREVRYFNEGSFESVNDNLDSMVESHFSKSDNNIPDTDTSNNVEPHHVSMDNKDTNKPRNIEKPKDVSDNLNTHPSSKLISVDNDHDAINDNYLTKTETSQSMGDSGNQIPNHIVYEKRKEEMVENGTKSDRTADPDPPENVRSDQKVSEIQNSARTKENNVLPPGDSPHKRPSFAAWSGKRDMKSPSLSKRPSFSPWSGKRGTNSDISTDKRPSFSPWSGKRDSFSDISKDKRPSFSPWSGKRDSFSDISTDKRPSFSPWSGKRDSFSDISTDKRPSFSPWSGKRDSFSDISTDKRPSFSPWSGKRDSFSDISTDKRPSFSPWSGKRDSFSDISTDKRPSFSPWSGKRGTVSDISTDKRPSFSPWSGKRDSFSDISTDKRPSFSPWSGKRTLYDDGGLPYKRGAFAPWSGKRGDSSESRSSEKRPSFSPWSGKRGVHSVDISSMKRAAFAPWSGKRNMDERLSALAISSGGWGPSDDLLLSGKRGAFAPWSGKRSLLIIETPSEKRAAFAPWSGKRSFLTIVPVTEKRPSFSPWSGKRSVIAADLPFNKRPSFHAWSGKRFPGIGDDLSLAKRPSFSPWSGKRTADDSPALELPNFSTLYEHGLGNFNSLAEKRPSFHPWSGKRVQLLNGFPSENHMSLSTDTNGVDPSQDSPSNSDSFSENSSVISDLWPTVVDLETAGNSLGKENIDLVENYKTSSENHLRSFKDLNLAKDQKDNSIIQNSDKSSRAL